MKNLPITRICNLSLIIFFILSNNLMAQPVQKRTILKSLEKLLPGDTLYSSNSSRNGSVLVYQKNGNLLLLKFNPLSHVTETIWQSSTPQTRGILSACMMTTNGNLSLLSAAGEYWSSGTSGIGNYLRVEDKGIPRVVIYNKIDSAIWANGFDIIRPPTDMGSNILRAGQSINMGQGIYSPDKSSYLSLEQDGNLVFRWIGQGLSRSRVIWKTNAKSNYPIANAKYFTITADGANGTKSGVGDLKIFKDKDSVAWNSNTFGAGNYLEVNNDLEVVINAANNACWWRNGIATIIPTAPVPGQQIMSETADVGYENPLDINLHDYTSTSLEIGLFFGGVFGGDGDINASAEGGDVGLDCGRTDVNDICPQHRSVGETSALSKPKASYQILEGVVQRHEASISSSDFPTSHYTHDFDFNVKPDPAFHFLLGGYYGVKQTATCIACSQTAHNLDSMKTRLHKMNLCGKCSSGEPGDIINCINLNENILDLQKRVDSCGDPDTWLDKTKILDSKDDLEVEWESGLASGNTGNLNMVNPAVEANSGSNSWGFFSTGHNWSDVIWNWPTYDDWVHVEGIWIFERGHRPAHTEIHPGHFIAVKRNLPVSFSFDAIGTPLIKNKPNDRFIATRVDVFASADGSAMWNTKGLHPDYVQVVDMQRKDYTFLITPALTQVPNSKLKWAVLKQKGDNFPAEPVITLLPTGQVQVNVPWKTKLVSNTAVFARTILIYWDDTPLTAVTTNTVFLKVVDAERPKLYQVNILKINLLKQWDEDNSEGFTGYGQYRVFGNIGDNWIFLNEFADYRQPYYNVLGSGLGLAAGNPTTGSQSYGINDSFNVYVAHGKSFRIAFGGWEADGSDYLMGGIFNEYSRDKEALSQYFAHRLYEVHQRGDADDVIGSVDQMLSDSELSGDPFKSPSIFHGSYVADKKSAAYDIIYTIKEIPYTSTITTGSGNIVH